MDEKTPAGSVNLLDDTLLESPGSVAGDKMSQSLPHRYVLLSGMYYVECLCANLVITMLDM